MPFKALRKRRLPPKLQLCLLCLILLFLAGALFIALLPFLVSTDAIRLRLAHNLSSLTGYNVQLREPPQVSVFPGFHAVLPDVLLTDNSQSGAALMRAEKIIVHMSLPDALRGRARFSETRLIRPHFIVSAPLKAPALFAALAHSEGNFGSAVRATQNRLREAENPAGGKPANAAAADFRQPFGHIFIEDGRLSYAAPAQPDAEIRNINAEIDWPQGSAAATVSATGLWHSVPANFSADADNALLLLSGGKSRLRVSLNSVQGGVTFTGAAQFGSAFRADGRLAARSPGLERSLSWLGLRLPLNVKAALPFAWESRLKADAAHAELSDIALAAGDAAAGGNGRGALEITAESGLPHIGGSLAFENLTINLPAAALFAADTAPESKNRNVDMPMFNLFGLDIRISSDKAVVNGIPVDSPAASIQIGKSGLIFDIGAMRIFDGAAQSSLRLQSKNDRIIGIESRFSSTGTDLSALQKAFAAAGRQPPLLLRLAGKANINLNLQAALPDKPAKPPMATARLKSKKRGQVKKRPQAAAIAGPNAALPPSYADVFAEIIRPYARGQFSINLNGGSLAHFDMPAFIARVQSGQNFPLADIAGPGQAAIFKFDRLEGKFAFNKGELKPFFGFAAFGSHRLEWQGEADMSGDKLRINGVFDPIHPGTGGQCYDTQCLQRSLVPLLQFTAQKADKAADKAVQIIPIAPKAGILPH